MTDFKTLGKNQAPIDAEMYQSLQEKLKQRQLETHKIKLESFKNLFSKFDKTEDSVWLQVNSIHDFMLALGYSIHLTETGKHCFSKYNSKGIVEILSMQDAVALHNGTIHWVKFGMADVQLPKKLLRMLKSDYNYAQQFKLVEQVDLKWSNKQNCYVSQKKLVKFMEIKE